MKFDSKMGQEVRTWILFFVGIGLAIVFALKGNPLNPWWTLVIGAFTSTAIIVSAVQTLTGGKKDEHPKDSAKVAQSDRGSSPRVDSEKENASTFSATVGNCGPGLIWGFRRNHTAAI